MQSQLAKLASKWLMGLADLERAVALTPQTKRHLSARELAIARTCFNHFQSAANQVAFYVLRDQLKSTAAEAQKVAIRKRLAELTKAEMELARDQYFIARSDALIGYEA